MDFDNAEKIIESGKKKPQKTLAAVIVLIVLLGIIAYVQVYFSEKAKQHASTLKEPVNANGQDERIDQNTEGDKSPAIVSGGDVKIEYGGDK